MKNRVRNSGWRRRALKHRAMAGLALAAGIALVPLLAGRTAQAQSFSVIWNFGPGGGGESPAAGLIADPAGNFYGTASAGGAYGHGAVYELYATGGETALYSFKNGPDGASPYGAGLIRDMTGNLYGAAPGGGNFTGVCSSAGCGVVFKVSPLGKETVLYTFTGGSDGWNPTSALIRDAAGNLYGSAAAGGSYSGPCATSGCGVIFKLSKAGQETVLYSFTGGSDGAFPAGSLIRDGAGNLYGTASGGGTHGYGVVFKLDSAGNETVLYPFTGGSDGAYPFTGLIQDVAGNVYGTTPYGGNFACSLGCGVIFKLDSAGNETVLYSFAGGTDGSYPGGGVLRNPSGGLYGTTTGGGDCGGAGCGTVFMLSATGKKTALHNFTGTDGLSPHGNLFVYKGYLYGTTYEGGPDLVGVIYKLIP